MDAEPLGTPGNDFIHVAGDGRTPPPGSTDLAVATDGNDLIEGLGGRDIVFAGEGRDRVFGDEGGDDLRGGRGSDTLHGGDGADLLRGGAARNVLWGDAGADKFLFRLGLGDTIADFTPGEDLINLRRIDADTATAGDQAFSFIGASLFSGVAGELRYADGLVQGDVDGDGTADLQIALTGSPVLADTNFVL